MPGRVWTQERLIETIRQLSEQGVDLSPTAIQKTHGALFSSARSRSHFGNWRDAIQAAGLSYDEIKRVKQRWSREEILQQIKQCTPAAKICCILPSRKSIAAFILQRARIATFGSWRRAIAPPASTTKPCAKAASGPKPASAHHSGNAGTGQPLGWAHIKTCAPASIALQRRKENFGSWHNALIACRHRARAAWPWPPSQRAERVGARHHARHRHARTAHWFTTAMLRRCARLLSNRFRLAKVFSRKATSLRHAL
jgi:hypothetical protein